MLTYSFTDIGNDSLYEYLYKCIKNDILNGTLTPGTKLPSKRSFAENLGISTITIETAYSQLIAEGYIYSLPKKGYFITDIKLDKETLKPIQKTEDFSLSPDSPEYFADFTSNQTEAENFPFSVWAKLLRETIRDNSTDLLKNSPSGGILNLREAISEHLYDFRGVKVSPDQIIVGAGTEYLYGLLIQLLGFNKKYCVENPGYKKISQIYSSNNVECDFVNMDKNGVIINDLESTKADVIHISPSHHFPSGIVMPISRRYELLGWASKSDSRYIIEDDYDSEFRLSGQPIPTLQSIDVMEKVIYINTFTKSLASTVRISYMVLPKHLVKEFYNRLSFYSCTVSNFEQYTLSRFIKEGYFEKHINRMRNFYHNRRDNLLGVIKNSPLSSYVNISEEDAGLHFLMYINTKLSDDLFLQRVNNKGIKLSSLSGYYKIPPKSTEHLFIINYSSIKTECMEEAVKRLYECLL